MEKWGVGMQGGKEYLVGDRLFQSEFSLSWIN